MIKPAKVFSPVGFIFYEAHRGLLSERTYKQGLS